MTIESLSILVMAVAVGYGIVRWFRNSTTVSPDPWGPEIEHLIQNSDAPPLCHRCFTPQSSQAWFCPECGTSVGPYNNYMPYVYIFSQGEVLRSGINDHIRHSFLVVVGYLLFSLGSYSIFAPVYWYLLFRNLRRHIPESTDEHNQES